MRYFFTIYALLVVLVISIGGFRGDTFKKAPIRVFSDMDDQDRIDAQEASYFFADGMGARQPVDHTLPQGLTPLSEKGPKSFTNEVSYYHTGMIDDQVFGTGLPVKELGLTEENFAAFVKRGSVVFQANCVICHGASGDGKGVVASYGVPGVANLLTTTLPDGNIYDVIVNGRGGMSAFGYQIDVRDRWAVVAYIHSLKYARKAPKEQVKEAFEAGITAQSK